MRVVLRNKVYDYWLDASHIGWVSKLIDYAPFRGLNALKKLSYHFKRRRDLERKED